MADDLGERTEDATPRRRSEARQDGNVARSQDLAGAMLLLASDRRVGAEGSYRVGFSEVSVGMPLPELPLLLARDRLDARRLQDSTLLGVLWEPAQAVEAGFLDFLAPAEELESEVSRQAQELARLPAQAYSESIPAVRGATQSPTMWSSKPAASIAARSASTARLPRQATSSSTGPMRLSWPL